jgi:hypothetical protein
VARVNGKIEVLIFDEFIRPGFEGEKFLNFHSFSLSSIPSLPFPSQLGSTALQISSGVLSGVQALSVVGARWHPESNSMEGKKEIGSGPVQELALNGRYPPSCYVQSISLHQ